MNDEPASARIGDPERPQSKKRRGLRRRPPFRWIGGARGERPGRAFSEHAEYRRRRQIRLLLRKAPGGDGGANGGFELGDERPAPNEAQSIELALRGHGQHGGEESRPLHCSHEERHDRRGKRGQRAGGSASGIANDRDFLFGNGFEQGLDKVGFGR